MNQRSPTIPTLALCALLGSCGGSDNQSPSPTRSAVASDKASCPPNGNTSGIEGTGLRNKLTGRITGITVAGANTTLAVGSTCSFTADGASVFRGNVPASISDLRLDQIITAEGDFTDTQNASATSIYILQSGANGQLPLVTLGESGAPYGGGKYGGGNLGLFDGSEYSVLPQAQVVVDGTPVSVTDLTIGEGEIVLLSGQESFPESNNPGGLLATSDLKITHMVDGPVDAIDLVHSQIVVLGVTVLLSSGTFAEMTGGGLQPGAINVGDRVTISGHPTSSGRVFASRISFSANSGDFLVSGIVRSPDTVQRELTLNAVTINYSTAQLVGVPAGGPADGERVLVRATRASNGTVLNATLISDESGISDAAIGTTVAMHGIVTSELSPSLLTVDGYSIKVSDAALQACGSTPPVDSDVTLQGTLTADGTVLADVFFCFTGGAPTPPGIVQGTIQKIDPNYGTISILGFSAQPSVLTSVVDSRGSLLSIGDLKVGDSIAVDGAYVHSTPGLIVAEGIVRLQGVARSLVNASASDITFADPIFYVSGWPIETDSSTVYFGAATAPSGGLTRAKFFAGPTHWPGWDQFCPPSMTISVRINPDGSLTALWVGEDRDLGAC